MPLYRGPRLRWLQRGFVEELLLLPEMPCLFQGLAHQVQMAMIMTQSLDVKLKLRLWQRDIQLIQGTILYTIGEILLWDLK